jgi:hypothetical protein
MPRQKFEDQIHLTSCAWTRFGRFPTSMAAGKSRTRSHYALRGNGSIS